MISRIVIAALAALALPCSTWAAPVNQVNPASITGTALITFDDVAGGGAPGTNYNAIFESGNATFAERSICRPDEHARRQL